MATSLRNIDGVGRDRVRNGFIMSEPRIDHAAKRLPSIACRLLLTRDIEEGCARERK